MLTTNLRKRITSFLAPVPALVLLAAFGGAQDADRILHVEPANLELKVGQTVQLRAGVLDAAGAEIPLMYFTKRGGPVVVDRDGAVTAVAPGTTKVMVRTAFSAGKRVSTSVPVTVAFAGIHAVEIINVPDELFAGTETALAVRIVDEMGIERGELEPVITTSDESIMALDAFGRLVALAPGRCSVSVAVEGVVGSREFVVRANPVHSLRLTADATHARTGDVVRFQATALDREGHAVLGLPVHFSLRVDPDDDLGPSATGQIEPDGRFVAEQAGLYTIHASTGGSGTIGATLSVRIDARNVRREVKLIGRGAVQDVHTSDLWVWEGIDGRDYAVTGTWGADGETRFWDVTDPANMELISRITVDARTVNDVKVSEDGTLCIISREGASNRKNGIVLIDVRDPRQPAVLSTYTENLTGGVHNLFIWKEHVFALSAGRRYDIINIEDPLKPYRVSSFELDTPGHSIHDVWVVDGIAYSSNWGDGVYMVDVGNGRAGGSLENPVIIGHYAYPSGWNHAAFPYHDKTTGKFYVIAGDEAFPYGLNLEDSPTYPRGWLHFIDFTDPEHPEEVARYEVPEAGTHNLWVEDDVLYAAYYNGGLRVIDISGELLGDLYQQGREMAFYLPTDPEGYVHNASMVWGPQPHKGRIFFSDWNSGLWSVELALPEAD